MEHYRLFAGFLEERLVFFKVRNIQSDIRKVFQGFMCDFVGVIGLNCQFFLEQGFEGDGKLGQDGL